jgi:DNA-binding transcriptional LysR family regulator
MDRIDAMKVFVTAVDEGSLAGAARRLKRSPTAVSRALTFLEARLGVELLHRTTRTLKLSEIGERYAAACRRLLTDLNEADLLASGERSSPRGVLIVLSQKNFTSIMLENQIFVEIHWPAEGCDESRKNGG